MLTPDESQSNDYSTYSLLHWFTVLSVSLWDLRSTMKILALFPMNLLSMAERGGDDARAGCSSNASRSTQYTYVTDLSTIDEDDESHQGDAVLTVSSRRPLLMQDDVGSSLRRMFSHVLSTTMHFATGTRNHI